MGGFRWFGVFLYISLLYISIGKNMENYLNYLNPPHDKLPKRREVLWTARATSWEHTRQSASTKGDSIFRRKTRYED